MEWEDEEAVWGEMRDVKRKQMLGKSDKSRGRKDGRKRRKREMKGGKGKGTNGRRRRRKPTSSKGRIERY